jgi:hypothetical protein
MPPLNKGTLLSNIRAIRNLPQSVNPLDRRDILLNLLLTYVGDNDINSAVWQAGFDGSLSASLTETIKKNV